MAGNSSSARGMTLPVPRASILGREQEMAAVQALLLRDDVPLVTLTGPGGVGKTRLALHTAAAIADKFADGAAFVPLAAIRDATRVLPTIASQLGIMEGTTQTDVERLAVALGKRELLLVLDNLEQVLDVAPLLADLLLECPALTILATSRATLRVSGEHEFPVPPLALPAVHDAGRPEDLVRSPAVTLFTQRAQASDPGFALNAANGMDVAAICARLDGLPLAIELAAVRVPVLPPQALLARLTDRLSVLTGGSLDHPPRLRSLRDAIDWSYTLLLPREQWLFRQLAVFEGGGSLEGIAAVCGSSELEAVDGVTELVRHSLLQQAADSDGQSRFGMLETVREYALEQLAASGEEVDTRARHAVYFLNLAEQGERAFGTSAEGAWVERLRAEGANLRTALEWADRSGTPDLLPRLVSALHWHQWVSGSFAEGRSWAERAVDPSRSELDTSQARARAMAILGRFLFVYGDLQRAKELLAAARVLAEPFGDAKTLAFVTGGLSSIAFFQGEAGWQSALAQDALAQWRMLPEPGWTAMFLASLGSRAEESGVFDEAEIRYEELLLLGRTHGSVMTQVWGLEGLGSCARSKGAHARAAVLLAEGLTLASDEDRPLAVAIPLLVRDLAALTAAAGEAETAAQLFGAVEVIDEREGSRGGSTQPWYGQLVAPARARLSPEAFAAAWADGRELSTEVVVAKALTVAASIATSSSEPPAARSSLNKDVSAQSPTRQAPLPHGLSAREVEVLQLVALGLTNNQIAERLFLSPKTVNSHLVSIFGKIGVTSRASATRFALEHGLG